MENNEWIIRKFDKGSEIEGIKYFIAHLDCEDYSIVGDEELCTWCYQSPPNYILFQYKLLIS